VIRKRFVAVLAALLCACATEGMGPPPSAPVLERPVEAIPSDLDIAIRLDVARIRGALGPLAVEALRKSARAGGADDPGGEELVADALERTDTLWLALRPGASARTTDSVLVLRGRFRDLDVRRYAAKPAWQGPFDLGASVRLYERNTKARALPARIYARGDDVVVFVTLAEIIERGVRDQALEPPERGIVSVAARPRPLGERVRERSPAAARFLSQSELVEATAELGPETLEVAITLTMQTEVAARRAADAAALLAQELIRTGGVPDQVARSVDIEALGAALVIRAEIPLAELARWAARSKG
jgi:hypothetical protein